MELTGVLDSLRSKVTARPPEFTTRTILGADVKPHECEAGWVYDGDEAAPCPACRAADAASILRSRLAAAGVAPRYLETTWDALELVDPLPAIKAACDRIKDVLASGHNAAFAGPPGTGKTQAAVLLARAAVNAGASAAIENIGRAAMRIRAAYDNTGGDTEAATVERLAGVDFLVLDDVGAGEAGEGKLELRLLYFITEARQSARKPTVVTTNLDAKALRDFLGARVANRLMPLEVFAFTHGRNFRTPKGGTVWRP